jgi:hypothetical protein
VSGGVAFTAGDTIKLKLDGLSLDARAQAAQAQRGDGRAMPAFI